MQTAIGHSENPHAPQALEEIIAQCRLELGGCTPSFGIFFTSRMEMNFPSALSRILDEWPDMQLVGCTTDGEISDCLPCTVDSLNLLVIHSEHLRFSIGLGEGVSSEPERAVRQALDQAAQGTNGKPGLGIVFSDGLGSTGVDFQELLNNVVDLDFPLFGGTAGDNFRLLKTFQFCGDKATSDALVVALVSGPVSFSCGFGFGHTMLGRTFSVTGCKGNILYEVEGLPALDFFEKYLGRNTQEYHQIPLAVLVDDDTDDFILRDLLFVNHEEKSLAFCGTFPRKPRIRLTDFTNSGLIAAAARTTSEVLLRYQEKCPDLALLCPCTSRRHLLGTQAKEEHAELLRFRTENPEMRIFGMYAYGEIGPLKAGKEILFHDASYALLLLGERT
ncbi:Uncharacterized conserved protein, contains FIST_N domain [Desulfonatronum zhilinae]|nr:Uncharacterized conserved protein, contains FIST_N domain [Desulfonatronum zhilinae]